MHQPLATPFTARESRLAAIETQRVTGADAETDGAFGSLSRRAVKPCRRWIEGRQVHDQGVCAVAASGLRFVVRMRSERELVFW